ncbi:serine/threonine-protein kinase [Streptomyces sp. NPDC017958]|uniref:serine/threonine-protein kinase n=1 Tax=Streptomyces sp. NPDC017958 TaxID=3365021 RepID=UPI003789EAB4
MGEAGEPVAGGIPGLLVNARYRLVESIGQGGMGRVWRAVDEMLDRLVAVKEIRIDGQAAEDSRTHRERTLREARATARIDHPNVVRVYDVVDEGQRLWIVMELVAGRSLERIMTEEGPLSPRETAHIGLGLVAALRQVHAGGVLHRDIKPGNVLVETGAGRVVLTDFGIAAIQDTKALTMVGMLVGSPDYMAPERVSGRRQGPPSDLWSLGATLSAALAGNSPFTRDTTLATLHAVLYEEPRLPPSAGPLRDLLAALLAKDPSARPGLAEVEQALRSVAYPPVPTLPFREVPTVEGGSVESEPVQPTETGERVGNGGLGAESPGGGGPVPAPTPSVSLARAQAVTQCRVDAPAEPAAEPETAVGPHPRRTVLLAVLGVVAVGVVVAVLAATSGGGGRREGAGGGTAVASSPTTSSSTAVSPGFSPTVSPTVDGTSRPHSPPPGARTEAGGFAWVPPKGWRRDVKTGAEVHYTSPDGRQELVGKSSLARGDLLDSWKRSERDAQQGRDYVKIRLAETRFQGYPAVVWEYTFTLRGTPWHARLLGFDAEGKSYQINTWYQPEIEGQAISLYDRVKDSFTVL